MKRDLRTGEWPFISTVSHNDVGTKPLCLSLAAQHSTGREHPVPGKCGGVSASQAVHRPQRRSRSLDLSCTSLRQRDPCTAEEALAGGQRRVPTLARCRSKATNWLLCRSLQETNWVVLCRDPIQLPPAGPMDARNVLHDRKPVNDRTRQQQAPDVCQAHRITDSQRCAPVVSAVIGGLVWLASP